MNEKEFQKFCKELYKKTGGKVWASKTIAFKDKSHQIQLFDEENNPMFSVPMDTSIDTIVTVWKWGTQEVNFAYQRGQDDAFKKLRELIGVIKSKAV